MATSEYIPEKTAPADALSSAPGPGRLSGGWLSASRLAPLPLVLSDVLVILLALAAAVFLRAFLLDPAVHLSNMVHSLGSPLAGLLYLAWFVLAYVLIARRYGLYGRLLKTAGGLHELRMTAQASLTAGLLLCGVLYLDHNLDVSRAVVVLLTFSATAALCLRRAVSRKARYRQYERGLSTRHVAVLGTGPVSRALARRILSESHLGYTFRGHIHCPGCDPGPDLRPDLRPEPAGPPGVQLLGSLADLPAIARGHFLDEVILAERCPLEQVLGIIRQARDLGIDLRTISGYYTDLAPTPGIEYVGSFPLVTLHRGVPRTLAIAFKRVGDSVLSFLALAAAAPAMLAIALAIRIEGPGPIIYVSERIGRRGRVFPCFKFRTMVSNADQLRKEVESLNERDGVLFKMKDDPRITRLGRFLRKYSFDELPQFFNVLRGEMSLVGPRPPLASEVEKYKLEHLRRLEVSPGLTGLWQIQARQNPSFEKYIALDTVYVENWSFLLDLKILLRTAEVVLRGTGT